MHLIDSKTGKVVASQTHSQTPHLVDYNDEMKRAVGKYAGQLVTIHNHPNSLPPSGSDFASNYGRDYKLGVVVAHNGDIYVYNNNDENATRYVIDSEIAEARRHGELKDVMKSLMRRYKISWKEL